MYVVLSGWVSEYRQLRDGTRQILDFRLPGEVTGTECLLYDNALYSAVTVTDSTVASISRELFEETQRKFPRLASAFLLSRIANMAALQERAVLIGRRPAFSRIAHLLMELDWRLRRCGLVPNGRIPFPLKQQDIADCTGLTSPYVNRVLKDMRARGLISLQDDVLEIGNPVELTRHAGFNPNYLEPAGQTEWQLPAGTRRPNGAVPAIPPGDASVAVWNAGAAKEQDIRAERVPHSADMTGLIRG